MRRLARIVLMGVALACVPAGVVAQDGLSAEQLKRMYEDTVVQLKTAQNSRNELARKNEKLEARITELEKELKETQAARNEIADKTLQARAEREAFTEFVRSNPAIRIQWQLFLEKNLATSPEPADLIDKDWPLSCKRQSSPK